MQKVNTFYSNRLPDTEFLEDQDSRLVYAGNWIREDSDSDVYWRGNGGYYANPGDQVSVEYRFYGTRFTIWAPATTNPDLTGANVRLYVDGVEVPGVTQRQANPDTSVEFNRSWAWYTSTWLPAGYHTFKLTSEPSSAGYIVFDGVQIIRTPAPTVKKTMQLAFGGTNNGGGDQTYFFDRVEVVDHLGQLVDAGLINSDFSYPPAGNGYYEYLNYSNDPLLGWKFGANSGIATNGSGFQVPETPDGNAVCFIQGSSPPTTQNMSLYPGKYRVRFIAAQRNDLQYNDGYVTVAGTQVMYVYPTQGVGFQTHVTDEFTV